MCRLHPEVSFQEDEAMQLTHGQRSIGDDLNPDFYAGRKLGEMEQALLWSLLQGEPGCPSRVLLDKAAKRQMVIAVSLRHVNRWRAAWGLNRRQGRPGHADGHRPVVSGAEVVRGTPSVACVGVHVFAHWLDQQEAFAPVVAHLTQAAQAHKQRHPDDDFALLHHRKSTLLHGFQALFYAPLLGIDRLSEFDTREHPLQTLIGHGYQSSTLSQFLGQLERVDAAESLMSVLVADRAGSLIYVDGDRIAYWTLQSMHKRKITMLGRIMAGFQARVAHDDAGPAVFLGYYPPPNHMSHVIVAYCQKVALATGSALFVIDRAVNAVALAVAFDAQGLGLLCMLDDNEHDGLESFAATQVDTLEDGTPV